MKRVISLFLISIFLLSLCGCSHDNLSGRYISEDQRYAVDFNEDGECAWLEAGQIYVGTYTKMETHWIINIPGTGSDGNYVFTVTQEDDYLIITRNEVSNKFYKE